MNGISLLLAVLGFLLVMGTWGWYMATIPRGNVPVWPIGSIILLSLGVVSALGALVSIGSAWLGGTIIVLILSVMSIGMAGFFFWLLTQRKTPIGDLQVAVGDTILPFDAVTSDGRPFHTDQIKGQRILLKFFRGGW